MSDPGFDRCVFINCPFDDEYKNLLLPSLFTILYFDFKPRIALESSDSGILRLEKILQLIKESRLSIHDISRLQSKEANEYYRLNMPFELGLDYSSKIFDPYLVNPR